MPLKISSGVKCGLPGRTAVRMVWPSRSMVRKMNGCAMLKPCEVVLLVCRNSVSVGAGLPAMAFFQAAISEQAHRYRRQASSHI